MSINIYWSCPSDISDDRDWSILYSEPESLYNNLIKNSNKSNMKTSFFKCPAFKNSSRNTFLIKNPTQSHVYFENDHIIYNSKSSLKIEVVRPESIINNMMIKYSFPLIFFSENSLNMEITSPYFNKCNYLNYGSIVPGKYDISKWYRPIQIEINLWENIKEFRIEKNEPLVYIKFDTEEKINFIQYSETDDLRKISNTCATVGSWNPGLSLRQRYSDFLISRTNKKVLKLIKENSI